MDESMTQRRISGSQSAGTVYGLGLLGDLVWFWQQSVGFRGHVVGVLKATVWPALLVYGAFKRLSG